MAPRRPNHCRSTRRINQQGTIISNGLRGLSDFVSDNGALLVGTEEIVFKEKNSTLIGTDGKRVVGW